MPHTVLVFASLDFFPTPPFHFGTVTLLLASLLWDPISLVISPLETHNRLRRNLCAAVQHFSGFLVF